MFYFSETNCENETFWSIFATIFAENVAFDVTAMPFSDEGLENKSNDTKAASRDNHRL